ncbi:MAG: DUF2029 domain-containing protein [Pirellulales bacterium]|nr:DUF2029 domain-containing protein [Pirellulales bacterium]
MTTLARTSLWQNQGLSRIALAAAMALLAAVYLTSPSFEWSRAADDGPFGGDALQEWLGGHVVLFGDHTRFYDRDYAIDLQHDPELVGYAWAESEYLPLVYPPFYYVATSPLALMPAREAAVVWAVLMLASALLSIYLWTRAWPWLVPYVGWICLAVAFYQPMVRNLSGGQKAAAMLAIFTGTFMLLRAQRSFAAGAIFGLLLFKPQLVPVLVLAMLIRRDWRFLAGFTMTGVMLGLVSLALGLDVCLQYVDLVLGMSNYIQTPGYRFAEAHSWQGFFALALGPERLSTIQVLTTTMTFLTVALMVAAVLRAQPLRSSEFAERKTSVLNWDSPHGMLLFAALTLASLLISPHLLTYDMTIALLPILLCVVVSTDDRLPKASRHELRLMAIGLYVGTTISTSVANTIGLQVSTLAMAIVAARLAWMAWSSHLIADSSSAVRDGR